MHVLKNKLVLMFVGVLLAFFAGCAGSSEGKAPQRSALDASLGKSADQKDFQVQKQEQGKQEMLEKRFLELMEATRTSAPAEYILSLMTDTSEYWLDTLEVHAKTYTSENLDTCQFYEVIAILTYRLYEREHLWATSDYRMLWLFMSHEGAFQKLNSLKLGPMKIKNDRGSVGLASSPDVPVMLFEWDDTGWKLNLVETIPLITKGMEATASKKKWSNKKLALYWLDREFHLQFSRLDESLYEPIGF